MSERQAPADPRLAPPPSLRARVLGDVAAAPASRASRVVPYSTLAAVVVWIGLRAWREHRRADWEALPASASWAPLADAVFVACLVTVLALSRGKTMVGPSARALWAAALAPIVITATALLLSLPTDATDAASLAAGGARFWPAALRCGSGALAVGIPVTLLLLAARRRLVFASPALVGAAAGIAAGSWAHAILHWGCPIAGAGHVMIGHALPTLPLAALGALVGWMVDRRALRRFTPRAGR